ncbi:MAG: aminotransferase class IV [Polyangiaceae bacterium]|nr:aminotransferase class IV [Polyangiaceae bacterium]NUQ78269.1 aminotransferase class IV [Polyangiaceae bacterium]
MPDLAYVNGRVTPVEDAVVSIDDRGFVFGDAVYEALRVYGGKPFALDRHQKRLQRSLAELRIGGADVAAIEAAILDLIDRSALRDAIVYWQVTRGAQVRDHAPAPDLKPTVVITVRAFKKSALLDYERGSKVIAVKDIRWGRVDIKSTNLLPNVLARWQAKEAGCYEAILVAGDIVREACATAVGIAREGALVLPKQGPWILPSITREITEELCERAKIPVMIRDFSLDELLSADEVLLMGSSTEIAGIVEVNGTPAGGGRVGPMTRKLLSLYRDSIAESLGISRSEIGD